ncbi:MAG: ABC transporter permease [Armatimonadetes bacterium]|nr:ABC transporter permease [Armatimonadota bacterium]
MKSPTTSPTGPALVNRLGPLLGLAVVYGLFAALAPDSFTGVRNMETIARQTAVVGTAALGMTMVIIAGGIDLSVGSIIALSTVTIASCLAKGCSPLVAASAGVLSGFLCGLLNGFIVTRLRVVPFIVTLGMLLAVRGIAKGFAHEQKVDAPWTALNGLLASLPPDQRWVFVPPGVWIMLVLAVAVAVMLKYTRFGRYVLAIGSSEQTSRLSGIDVQRMKLMVYAGSAAFAGLAGVMQFSRLTVGDPTAASGLELDVIAAVVIGGGSLSGGEGSIFGSLIGALIMTVIRSGCAQMGLANWVQEIITGGIIVAAVALDRLRHRRA